VALLAPRSLTVAKILVVDDNEQNGNLVAGMCIRNHHQLEFGTSWREAVEKAHTFRPNIVLIDIRMPDTGGRDALAEVRKAPELQLLPVIAVTASKTCAVDALEEQLEQFPGLIERVQRSST
jgi:CheY-like chemotaxis protein